MMKKMCCCMIAGLLILAPVSAHADEKDDRIAELELQVKQLMAENAELKEKLKENEVSEGADIEQYLLDKGMLTGDRIETAAEMVGAEKGFKYGNTEIYIYDMESEAYTELVDSGSIELQGFDGVALTPVAINGAYVLIGEATDELIEAFEEYK